MKRLLWHGINILITAVGCVFVFFLMLFIWAWEGVEALGRRLDREASR
jgi:Na+-transporting methylmalonyl-CoA/oxaloacetate decarboxylase gamma subunit